LCTEAVRSQLGASSPDDIGLLNHAPALARLSAEGPLPSLLRLFFLEADEPLRRIRSVFSASDLRALMKMRLVASRAGSLRARMRIDCVRSLQLLADRRFRSPDTRALGLPPGDMVYPPGGDSTMLADVVAECRGRCVLDLCTGSGVQGLIAAATAEQVVGVDVNPRAVALAGMNAILNGVGNIEVRWGDLFAPVRGEHFDLIIANPPFVPAPRRGPSYHSGGPRGDRVLRRVVSGLPDHLADGGRAVMISHLALRHGEDVAGVMQPWLRRFRGRTLALVLESGSPIDLAAAQSLFALDRGFAAYAREVRTWVAYLRRHRIREIVLLIIVAEARGNPSLEVREAFQRVLPIPLSRSPVELIREWCGPNEA
jgi:carbamoyltransferase